jgi:hypothetical protein
MPPRGLKTKQNSFVFHLDLMIPPRLTGDSPHAFAKAFKISDPDVDKDHIRII